jgi:hypothetical protein
MVNLSWVFDYYNGFSDDAGIVFVDCYDFYHFEFSTSFGFCGMFSWIMVLQCSVHDQFMNSCDDVTASLSNINFFTGGGESLYAGVLYL